MLYTYEYYGYHTKYLHMYTCIVQASYDASLSFCLMIGYSKINEKKTDIALYFPMLVLYSGKLIKGENFGRLVGRERYAEKNFVE